MNTIKKAFNLINNRIKTFCFRYRKNTSTPNTTSLCCTADKSGIPLQLRFFIFFCITTISLIVIFTLLIVLLDIHGNDKKNIETYAKTELERTTETIDIDLDKLILQSASFSETVSKNIDNYLEKNNIAQKDFNKHPEIIIPLLSEQSGEIISAMKKNSCSGTFIVLDATVNPEIENASNSKAGIFLKDTYPNSINELNSKIHYLRGPASIARENHIELLGQWKMEFDITNNDFFYKIINTAKENPTLSLSRLYYLTNCFRIKSNSEAGVLLCMPLRSSNGEVYGICGMEISDRLFKQKYTPNSNEYKNVFITISPANNTTMHIENGMIAGNYFLTGIRSTQPIEFTNYTDTFYLYENSETKYVGLHSELNLYPNDSPYKNEKWYISLLMPKTIVDSEINGNTFTLFTIVLLLLFSSLILSIFISKKSLHPVTTAIDDIKTKNYKNKNIYTEINDLMEFLEQREKEELIQKENIIKENSSKEEPIRNNTETKNTLTYSPSTLDNFIENLKTLSNAERKVFDLYLKGYKSQEIADNLYLSINTIKTHNRRIFAKLNVSTRKELMIYIDMLKERNLFEEAKN